MPLSDGRWHFQHGPIDIVILAQGDTRAVEQAHQAAWNRFSSVLTELVGEIVLLRSPVGDECELEGQIAKFMWHACRACMNGSEQFITPMAAVAGSVAQCLIEYYRRDGIERACIHDGGDIALHLQEGQSFTVGLFSDLAKLNMSLDGKFRITSDMGVHGIATSGWRGRSFSLGIADSVTVLAESASYADAAATLIANKVNIDEPGIVRRPANTIKDDSDLGALMVTVDVPDLSVSQIESALQRGLLAANELKNSGLIFACVLSCKGWVMSTEKNAFTRLN
jgi:ApbE superfamily uncharacterized protein (UPF0280 family)